MSVPCKIVIPSKMSAPNRLSLLQSLQMVISIVCKASESMIP